MDREQIDIADIEAKQRRGLLLLTLGWTLLIFDAIVVMWFWTGLRAGSSFWSWWVVIEGLAGAVFLGIGTRMRVHSGQHALAEPTEISEETKAGEKEGAA
jgi:fatty acid desaturase